MNNAIRLSAIGLLGLTLTGCSNFCLRDMGNSSENNLAVQTIYAEPVDDAVSPSFDGAKAGPVLEKYRRADTRAADQPLLRNGTN
jgi:type IV pilus biogenesis protein CpaD/CtpE